MRKVANTSPSPSVFGELILHTFFCCTSCKWVPSRVPTPGTAVPSSRVPEGAWRTQLPQGLRSFSGSKRSNSFYVREAMLNATVRY